MKSLKNSVKVLEGRSSRQQRGSSGRRAGVLTSAPFAGKGLQEAPRWSAAERPVYIQRRCCAKRPAAVAVITPLAHSRTACRRRRGTAYLPA